MGYVKVKKVIFRSGRKRKPISALLPHGSCATMASPVVQVIFVDESEFENEGNWYFSEHKSVEWEIHSIISQSTSSLGELSDSEEVELNTDTSSDDNSSDCETYVAGTGKVKPSNENHGRRRASGKKGNGPRAAKETKTTAYSKNASGNTGVVELN